MRVLKLPEVCRKLGKSKSQVYRDIAAGVLAPPIPLGPKARGWLEHELDAYLADRIRERDGHE
jgi:prophage regulatory protein